MSRIDPNEVKKIFNRGCVLPGDTGLLTDICEMVYLVHMSHRYNDRDDLIQEGLLGLIRLVDEGNFDETKGDIMNFVYARVRNCMHNYLYYEDRGRLKSLGEDPLASIGSNEVDIGWFGYISGDLIDDILLFVENKIKELLLSDDLANYVLIYFLDKLGKTHQVLFPSDFSLDFVSKYRYYVNLIEYGVFVKFINKNVFDNKVTDIISVLEAEGEVGFFMKMFLESLTYDQLTKLLYVYSLNSFSFPSKYKLLKIDSYLSIYKRVMHGNLSIEEASRLFDKPSATIESILNKYNLIFKENDES